MPRTSPAETRVPAATAGATGSTELRRPSSWRTVTTGRSTTTPACVTVPARGARTGVPAGARTSTPRCPAAHGWAGASNAARTTNGSTGGDHPTGPCGGAPGDGASVATAVAASVATAASSASRAAGGPGGGTRIGMPVRCRADRTAGAAADARLGTRRAPSPWGGAGHRPSTGCRRRPPADRSRRLARSGRLLPATGACRSTSRVTTEVRTRHRPTVRVPAEGRRRQRSGFVPASAWAWRQGRRPPGRRRQPDERVGHAAGPRSVCAPPTWARRKDLSWPS